MKRVSKNITFISALTLALLSQNTAFAQTVLLAEAPVATRPAATFLVTKNKPVKFAQPVGLAAEVIDLDTHTIKAAHKVKWESQPVAQSGQDGVSSGETKALDDTRWFLKPTVSRKVTSKNPKKYVREFAGLRPTILSSNNAKIGTSTQYIEVGEQPYLNYDKTSKNIFAKDPKNHLVSAKLNF